MGWTELASRLVKIWGAPERLDAIEDRLKQIESLVFPLMRDIGEVSGRLKSLETDISYLQKNFEEGADKIDLMRRLGQIESNLAHITGKKDDLAKNLDGWDRLSNEEQKAIREETGANTLGRQIGAQKKRLSIIHKKIAG